MKYIALLIMCAISITCYGMHNNSPLLKAIEEKDERIALLEKELLQVQDEARQLRDKLKDSTQFTAQLVTELYQIKHGNDQPLLLRSCN